MRIVMAATEAVPFAKTGGLADVAGTLPRALARMGHQVDVLMPFYRRSIKKVLAPSDLRPISSISLALGGRTIEAGVIEHAPSEPGLRFLFIDHPPSFDRAGFYQNEFATDYPDNGERFALFSLAVLEIAHKLELDVACFHCHDWQTGLVPALLRHREPYRTRFSRSACMFTIHNLAYQGLFGANLVASLGLDSDLFNPAGFEFFGKLSMLKAGIVLSDLTSTVSRTYAREIQEPVFGCGLDGVLCELGDRLIGIVNGIDFEEWNPATDVALAQNYDSSSWRQGKLTCKQSLRQIAGMPDRGSQPLLGIVGRLDNQKGYDLVLSVMRDLFAEDVQLVFLGSGHPRLEAQFRRLANRYPKRLFASFEFDEVLARRIYAGSDTFLMPSRFEPCGLSQLYSLRYGSVPIVRRVGGLADTVTDANPASLASRTATGFMFDHDAPYALWTAIRRALRTFDCPDTWRAMVARGMGQDWSWDKSAREYVAVYTSIAEKRSEGAG